MAFLDVVRGALGGLNVANALSATKRKNQIRDLQQLISDQAAEQGAAFSPFQSQEIVRLTGLDAALAERTISTFESLPEGRQKAFFEDARRGLDLLNQGRPDEVMSLINNRRAAINQFDGDTSDVDFIANLLQTGQIDQAKQVLQQTVQLGIDSELLPDPLAAQRKREGIKSSRQREFESLVAAAKNDPKGLTIAGLAALIDLGIMARKSKTAAERIAGDPELAENIARNVGQQAAAREGGKLTQQLKHLPSIRSSIKLAESEAKERGEVLTSLARSTAALPGLKESVSELRELALIATSTFGGRLFDSAVKQSGFGSTKGATSRAKFIAIINNQVLPLLKETFGAAFTVQEGESLKATMGDPDATPEEKLAQLDAFIAQKERDIQTREIQLSQPVTIGRFTVEVQ